MVGLRHRLFGFWDDCRLQSYVCLYMIELTYLSGPKAWSLTKTLKLIEIYSIFKRHVSPYLSTYRVAAA